MVIHNTMAYSAVYYIWVGFNFYITSSICKKVIIAFLQEGYEFSTVMQAKQPRILRCCHC